MKAIKFARLFWIHCLVIVLVAFSLFGAVRALADNPIQIYMYKSGGGVTNVSSTDSYQEPHIVITATGQQVGTVDPQTDDIYDSSDHLIGYITQ